MHPKTHLATEAQGDGLEKCSVIILNIPYAHAPCTIHTTVAKIRFVKLLRARPDRHHATPLSATHHVRKGSDSIPSHRSAHASRADLSGSGLSKPIKLRPSRWPIQGTQTFTGVAARKCQWPEREQRRIRQAIDTNVVGGALCRADGSAIDLEGLPAPCANKVSTPASLEHSYCKPANCRNNSRFLNTPPNASLRARV